MDIHLFVPFLPAVTLADSAVLMYKPRCDRKVSLFLRSSVPPFLRFRALIRKEGCYTGPLDFPTGGTLYRLSERNRAIGEMFS